MKISSRFLIGAIALIWEAAVLDSCRDYFPDNSYLYNYSQYNNFRAVTVNNPSDDHYVSIYYDQPFSDEGGVCAKEYLGGKGPFSMELNVPSHVKQLYVVDNGVLTVQPVGDLVVGAKTRGLELVDGELNALYDHVTSVYLPTAKYNVTGDDLFKCTDIRLEREGEDKKNQDFASFNISLVDLMKNGEKPNFTGNVFAYIYPKDKQHHLTLADCIFYGAAPEEGVTTFAEHINQVNNPVGTAETDKKTCPLKVITEAQMRDLGERVSKRQPPVISGQGLTAQNILSLTGAWPLLNGRHYGNAHIIISIPKEYEGYNLGFAYIGGQNLRFTTPAINIGFSGPADQSYADYPSEKLGNYLGFTLRYDKATFNGEYSGDHGDFILDRHVGNGFIWHFKYTFKGVEREYDVLGMDNQYPINKQSFYDADYADYKVLISSDPAYLKPVEEILRPIHTPFSLEEGYLMFEDTYPNEGDYDYNDVIVQYEWRHYLDDGNGKAINRVNCTLEGYACEYNNTFGFINTHENAAQSHHPIFTNIQGKLNVDYEPGLIDLEADGTRDVEYEFEGEIAYIKPYLNNQYGIGDQGDIFEKVGGDFKYPFVIRVPEVFEVDDAVDDSGSRFRWMCEGVPIFEAYESINSTTHPGWYKTIKDDTKVMRRN